MPSPLQTALDRIDTLGRISDSPSHLVRTFLSRSNRHAAGQMLEWMAALGMNTCHSPDGTVRGILPGSCPTAPPLLLGSHIDTVIDAGKYDGALGLIAALAALESLRQENITLPFPVHLLAFSDEEGVRFQTTYLGSRSVVEELDKATLASTDADGKSLSFVLATEGWHQNATPIHYEPRSTRGYIELHIEQGRVLEEAGEAACIVSAIAGQSRILVTLTGRADHAGTTPMPLRRDALAGAAECILATESIARAHPPLVATVGTIQVHPGASNSIPQSATFTIDLRHPDDRSRRRHQAELEETLIRLAKQRDLHFHWHLVQQNDAVPCDPALTESLLDALHHVTGSRRSIPSGAGHDGVAIAAIAPIGMIFIRCRDGLSHHPEEYATPKDIATGIQILTHFLKKF